MPTLVKKSKEDTVNAIRQAWSYKVGQGTGNAEGYGEVAPLAWTQRLNYSGGNYTGEEGLAGL